MPSLNKLREEISYRFYELFRYDNYDDLNNDERLEFLNKFSKDSIDKIYNSFINGNRHAISNLLSYILDYGLKAATRKAIESNPKNMYKLANIIQECFKEVSEKKPFSQEEHDKRTLNSKYYATLGTIDVIGVDHHDTEEDIKELRSKLFDTILEKYSKQEFIDKVNQASDKDIHILKRRTYSEDSSVISSSFTTTYYTEYIVKFLNEQYTITVVSHVASW